MLKYLINFDVDVDAEFELEFELDITDKSLLQEQINQVRKTYLRLIKLFDNLQGEYIETKSLLSQKNRELLLEFEVRSDRVEAEAKDPEHGYLVEKLDALRESMKAVTSQIDFIKNDMRVLNSSMYVR